MKIEKVGILRRGFTFRFSAFYRLVIPKNTKVVVSNGVLKFLLSNNIIISVKKAVYNSSGRKVKVFVVFANREFLGVIPLSSFKPSIPYPLSML